ncbi:unnamed protein product [Staurois parvus]|uniref:Uncharacterized protein n=1 Tax=Staurois parvus TaxID=386267 RepID=A0ABN9E6N0_9NEOB|nr:unnamed protein product [Staurois parvus]
MILGRKGLTSGTIKGSTVCAVLLGAVCLGFTVSTLLCMDVLCTAM